MKRIYNESRYLEEKEYIDWYTASVQIGQCATTICHVIEDIHNEVKSVEKGLGINCLGYIGNLLEILSLCETRLGEISNECLHASEKPVCDETNKEVHP